MDRSNTRRLLAGIIALGLLFSVFTWQAVFSFETPAATEVVYLPLIAKPNSTATPTGTATPTSTPPSTSTPTATPTQTALPAQVSITGVYAGTGSGLDEYVTIQNIGGSSAVMTAWTLNDLANHVYTFGAFTLPAGGTVRVWTNCGTNTATDVYWCSGAPIWNNTGDTAFLYNAAHELVSQFTY